MPPFEGLPSSYYATEGTDEYQQLLERFESGELSMGEIVDDSINNLKQRRAVFCPTDFDTVYVSQAAFKQLGVMGLQWIGDNHFSPLACHTASTEEYVRHYTESHK